MTLTKTNKQNKTWTLSDSNWAWDEYKLGRSHKYIARKLGRTEAAVSVNLSKTRMRLKTVPFKLDPTPVGPAEVKKIRKAIARKVTFTVGDMIVAAVGGGALGAIIAGLTL